MSPDLSVIIVVHREYLKYIDEALDALRRQTLHNFETVIVANGCRCKDAIETTKVTLAEACNIGIQQSTGRYIVRLDADDWIDETLLERELEILESNPDIDAVWCDYITAHEDKNTDWNIYHLGYLANHSLDHACGVMYKRTVWETLDGYDESLRYQESFDFWKRFERAGFKSYRLQSPLYIYRRGHESMSTNDERDAVRQELIKKYDSGK